MTNNNIEKPDYNKIPVRVCKQCLSLKIKCDEAIEPCDEYKSDSEMEYCGDCGNVDITIMLFSKWEKQYEEKYWTKFLDK